jgi:hypothetical protein
MLLRPLLLKKEFQQNSLIYLFPLPFWFVLLFLRATNGLGAIPDWLVMVFVYAVPLTLAVAYGLQAFDVEEDDQTRDFLLVKPLTIGRVIGEKFTLGLLITLVWSLLLILPLKPSLFEWPKALSVSSWVCGLLLIGVTLTFGASFVAGVCIKGPQKLLVALVVTIGSLIWFLATWSSLVTFIFHQTFLSTYPWFVTTLFYLSGLLFTVTVLSFHLVITHWILQQRPQLNEDRLFFTVLILSILFPLISIGLNLGINPPIRGVYFAGAELFGLDQPFWPIDGVWSPDGASIAVSGSANRIGLIREGSKPELVYQGEKVGEKNVKDLIWSPDSKNLAFCEDGQVYILNLNDKKRIWVGSGSSPFWSVSSDELVFTHESSTRTELETSHGKVPIHDIVLYRADLTTGTVSPYSNIKSDGLNWAWNSQNEDIYVMSPYGHLYIYSENSTIPIPLPEFNKNERVFLTQYTFVPDQKEYNLAVFSMPHSGDRENITVRFYRFDYLHSKLKFIYKIPRFSYSGLILNHKNGDVLYNINTAYVRKEIPGYREESQ